MDKIKKHYTAVSFQVRSKVNMNQIRSIILLKTLALSRKWSTLYV